MHQPLASADAVVASLAAGLADWSLMVVAMMVPLVAASVRMVAARSLWRRRHRAVIIFLSSYVLVWSVVGWAALALVTLWLGSVASSVPATVALLLAAAWQTTSSQTARADGLPPQRAVGTPRLARDARLRPLWSAGRAALRRQLLGDDVGVRTRAPQRAGDGGGVRCGVGRTFHSNQSTCDQRRTGRVRAAPCHHLESMTRCASSFRR